MQEETGRLWSKERGVDWKRELKKYKEKVWRWWVACWRETMHSRHPSMQCSQRCSMGAEEKEGLRQWSFARCVQCGGRGTGESRIG